VTYCTSSVSEIPLVAVEGEIDPRAALALQRRLAIALKLGRGFVAVDLRAVSVDGEQATGLLCDALRRANRHEARLALAGAPPAVCRALEHSIIDGVELYPTLGTAVGAACHPSRPGPAARPLSSCPTAPGPRRAVHQRPGARQNRKQQHA